MNNLTTNYYNLKELSPIVNVKYRQLQIIVKKVGKKYENNEKLLFKKSNRWYIHSSIIKEFKRQRNPIDYKLFITIASKNQFDIDYWKYFITKKLNKTLKKIDASTRVKYVIEKTKRNVYHLHFITNFGKIKTLKSIIKKDDITNNSNDMNAQVQYIYDVKGLHKYFRKQNKPVLLK
jgi:hypothetical protein